ncbi:hypothetical protein [Paenibacillus polymyxa]|uniref:hypothetical protein n=1 Tax=Paenibacillus polymyxa TaxID=1406 RepID=UPI000AF18613|nr:hypothetical protein [Paenibacillus polymyxa]
MGWKHIVLEASCFYEDNEENHGSKCCKGNIGVHCLTYNQDVIKFVPIWFSVKVGHRLLQPIKMVMLWILLRFGRTKN